MALKLYHETSLTPEQATERLDHAWRVQEAAWRGVGDSEDVIARRREEFDQRFRNKKVFEPDLLEERGRTVDELKSATADAPPSKEDAELMRPCAVCSTPFMVRWQRPTQKYCTPRCRKTAEMRAYRAGLRVDD